MPAADEYVFVLTQQRNAAADAAAEFQALAMRLQKEVTSLKQQIQESQTGDRPTTVDDAAT